MAEDNVQVGCPDFYQAFKDELAKVTIMGNQPAASVVGECIRAAKRAQNKIEDQWFEGQR